MDLVMFTKLVQIIGAGVILGVAAIGVLVLVVAAGVAARTSTEPDALAVQRAHDLLDGEGTGRFVLQFVHLGQDYTNHSFVELRRVTGGDGAVLPKEFALEYRYTWNHDDKTTMMFFFDADGRFTHLQVLDTTAILHQPFAFAGAATQLLASTALTFGGENMTAEEKQQTQYAADHADGKTMLENALKSRQQQHAVSQVG
jgi:hypothetical protein